MAGISHSDPSNKKIALLISILALILALTQALGKAAQTEALAANIEASNLWAFFQAKTVRATMLRTAMESFQMQPDSSASEAANAQLERWKQTVERYESEPSTNEGRKELAARAKAAEAKRDRSMAAYHQLEIASGAVEIGIVLASASIITSLPLLAWFAAMLGSIGALLTIIGAFAPMSLHLF